MGYSLHIERPGKTISQDEWEAWVNEAPDFVLRREWQATNPQTGAVINVPCLALGEWTRPDGDGMIAFDYSEGRINVRADQTAMDKAKEIAKALGGQLAGDEGEIYYPPPPKQGLMVRIAQLLRGGN